MGFLRNIANRCGLTNSAKFERLISEDRAVSPEEYRFADEVLAAFHSGGGLAPRMQAYKLVSLNRLLEAKKPKSILELGSGSSTVVFGRYAARNNAKVVTIDESREWLDNTISMLKLFGVSDAVTSHVCEKRIDTQKNTATYIDRPSFDAELLLIDGPALEVSGQKYTDAVCTDIFDIVPTPKTVLIDIRRPTVERMQKDSLFDGYECLKSDILSRSPKANFNYFSVFTRK